MASKIGKYELLEVLGRGGMGVVYKAYDAILDREVALKTMTAEGLKDPVLRERFYREARAAGRLRHPNIVTIYELGEEEGLPYIAMEYLTGSDVHHIISTRTEMDFEQKLRVVIQLCRGLAYAHKAGIVHRDVKPSNIHVTEDHQVKILDFGIARVVTSQTMTTDGMVLGTIHYMAPEQIKGGHVDGKADIFAAGIILYELLTFRRPFEGDNTGTILYNILHAPPHPMQPPVDEQFPAIKRVLTKSMEKDPACRYYSADEMADDMEQFLNMFPKAPAAIRVASTLEVESQPDRTRAENPPEPPRSSDPKILEMLRTAKRLIVAGNSIEAYSSLKNLIGIDPENPEARQLMQVLEQDIKRAESEELLEQAQRYLREGRYDIAEKAFEKILKVSPGHSKAKLLLHTLRTELMPQVDDLLGKAKEAYAAKKYHLARQYTEQVLQNVPEHKDAQEILLALKERITTEEFNELLQAAENFMREGEYDTAVKAVEKALKIFPSHPVALKRMETVNDARKRLQIDDIIEKGNKQLELGNYDEARGSFSEILQLDPDNETAKMVLGSIEEKHRAEEARELLNLGWRTLMMDRNFDEVIRIGQQILSLDPSNPEASSLIASAKKEQDSGQ
jgi:serine/threonine protein kinase